ncbi:sugar O-acyltransferase (sialic acid O-acetyltransferase NeuD family) [Aquamicrobium lusatiense]|uniref:Sugar O-acyltransferase (Sialic acid O-acetyltransferase NeuD family) n=1 Tax=Aquamicrobium lusatiense TaxID=89772 RepID=A0A7W9S196_9HYPH|nr:acetyltransferase [Aquamicrobium lusatiense]MBB6012246.1 sugar O-acyltransferase (sialic acid O-acetyltransferase NeuD family) [Aquamicrobium lusatiense]
MTKRLLVLGCGGHGRVVADAALDCGYDAVAFLDDAHATVKPGSPFEVLGPIAKMQDLAGDWPAAIAAIGDNERRLELFMRLRAHGFRLPCIVHPSAVVSRAAGLGEGVFVAAGAIVNTGARIGDAAILNTGSRIDHDCHIGTASHIAPGATLSGNVKTGEKVWLGTGCSVRQGVTIGSGAVVGVGAAVVGDLAPHRTYVGVPARPFKEKIL